MNEREYRAALRAAHCLIDLDPELHTPIGQALDHLVHVVEEYEQVHFHFERPSEDELARFRAEEASRTD